MHLYQATCPNGDVYRGNQSDLYDCDNGAAFESPGLGQAGAFENEVYLLAWGAGDLPADGAEHHAWSLTVFSCLEPTTSGH